MPSTKPKSATTNGSKLKDLSVLYKKPDATKVIPIQVPALGIDIELDFNLPDEEVMQWLDEYIIHVTRAYLGNTDLTDEQLLATGKSKIVNLSAYMRKLALQDQALKAVQEVGGVKNAELVALRDRMTQLVKDLEYSLSADYEEKEALTFSMISDEKAVQVLYRCIAKCFPEIENPATLTQQIKYVLALALLGATGKTIVV